jgi:flagellar motor switch protein FliN/FliY
MSDHSAEPCADAPRLSVVIGRCWVNRDAAQQWPAGQLVPLDEPADAPVEVYVDGQLVARGELLALDGKFCVRVTEIISQHALPRAA